MDLLDEKLGPLLLQFPWFNKYEMQRDEFCRRLRFFLQRLKDLGTVRFVVEDLVLSRAVSIQLRCY